MPMIPRQTNQTVFTEGVLPSQRIDAEPADFGALQAGAMQRVGQNLAQAGQETTQTVMLQQQYANESSSTQALNAFQSKAEMRSTSSRTTRPRSWGRSTPRATA